jgi:hypothetical protein
MDAWRQALDAAVDAARAADAAASPVIPPFAAQPSLAAQGQARLDLAGRLERILGQVDPAALARWGREDADVVRRARQQLTDAAGMIEVLHAGPLDGELALVARTERTGMAELGRQLAAIDAYVEVASRWYGVFFFGRRARASLVLARYALPPGRESAGRLRRFVVGLRARLVLQSLYAELTHAAASTAEAEGGNLEVADDVLDLTFSRHTALFDLLLTVHAEPALAGLAAGTGRAVTEPAFAAGFLEGLRQSPARAAAVEKLQSTLAGCGLFDAAWLASAMQSWRNGEAAGEAVGRLRDTLDSLEDVLRVRTDLGALPGTLRGAVEAVLGQPLSAEEAWAVLHRAALANAITERLRSNANPQALDRQRLQSSVDRFRELEQTKARLVRDLILHRWVTTQQERLLVSTGSRLSSMGADLRRRLTMRGERALRLRQVVAVGKDIEGGDPLFDLRPVWMASPETVAQVFPLLPLFHVVVFDEASQCRLEEALPVLTRAHRVVIAGDPKQLPPTRFFESAVVASEDDEVETEQQLFEAHQGEVEDLLTAALGLDIEQCYLDVHYRSRNADLIAFSNQQFYSERLQPIPGHPSQRTRFAPITLYRADGVYEERTNPAEAERVCRIVSDLLRRAEPPSIGVASFNLAQRDLIVEKLEEMAAEDPEFAGRLAEARARVGPASFEGLFVKNLENVQGDERDHIIISTTYGPDAQGRFYRRFGPLGRAGGGRRLNVLVTRARQELHLVTSIPAAVYRSLPPVPAGQAPGGAWLLFAYLAFAEGLTAAYEDAHRAQEAGEPAGPAAVRVHPTRAPSPFAAALARVLADEQQTGSDVYWGNDGFCVDLALHHPRRADDVTVGVLCDGVRFSPVDDPVAWDLFRTAVLEGQGWKLHRLWTPHFFRDPRGSTEALRKAVAEFLAAENRGGTP